MDVESRSRSWRICNKQVVEIRTCRVEEVCQAERALEVEERQWQLLTRSKRIHLTGSYKGKRKDPAYEWVSESARLRCGFSKLVEPRSNGPKLDCWNTNAMSLKTIETVLMLSFLIHLDIWKARQTGKYNSAKVQIQMDKRSK